ncbi:phage head-tail joining protein [Reyranella sp.]|uniref:phage head-tail joining protein n=1 Tax=Reyranella sp. TaxID=1929291 RepID=UPI003F7083DA
MATALTQADLDKLERAYARGVLTVSYAGQSVTFANSADMLKRIQYVKDALAGAADQRPPSTYASFERC